MTIVTMGLACCLAATAACAQAKSLVINPVWVINPRLTVLAMPDFAAADPQLHRAASDMTRLIGVVLQRSCPVKLINNVPGIDIDVPPDASYWRSIKADIVTVGRLAALADGRIRIEVRMWDVSPGHPVQIFGQQFTASPDAMERLGYILAGNVFERLCGDDAGFIRTPE
jgi:TolB protein